MRDLIDRKELLEWMERFHASLAKSEDISPSYLNGYRSAMQDVQMAAKVEQADA